MGNITIKSQSSQVEPSHSSMNRNEGERNKEYWRETDSHRTQAMQYDTARAEQKAPAASSGTAEVQLNAASRPDGQISCQYVEQFKCQQRARFSSPASSTIVRRKTTGETR